VVAYLSVPGCFNSDHWWCEQPGYHSKHFSLPAARATLNEDVRWPHSISEIIVSDLLHSVFISDGLCDQPLSLLLGDHMLVKSIQQSLGGPFPGGLCSHFLHDYLCIFQSQLWGLEHLSYLASFTRLGILDLDGVSG
jgi:hypothetical protein